MSRKEFEVLWELRDQIVSEIKKLKVLEQKEKAVAKRGQSILCGLSKTNLPRIMKAKRLLCGKT